MNFIMFFLILAAGIAGLLIYRKVSPENFAVYLVWVVFIELLNALLFWPFPAS